jgi:lysophospholipase L1-like esterase
MQGFDGATFYQKDPELGAIPRPNVSGVHAGFNSGFTTNEQGLRGADSHFIVPKPVGVKRVVVLGDSFAWGYGVEDDEIFTEILERRLSGVEVVNLGVISFDLRDEFAYLKREGMRYEPDAVLLAVCHNDIRLHEEDATAKPVALSHPLQVEPTIQYAGLAAGMRPVKEFLSEHSYTFAFAQQAVNSSKTLTKAAVWLGVKEEYAGIELLDASLHASLIEYQPQVQKAFEQYQADLLEIAAYLRERDIKLLVALIPPLQAVDPEQLDASIAYTVYDREDFDMNKLSQFISEMAVTQGFEIVDAMEAVKGRAANSEKLYLPRDMHFNAAGHRVFADAILPVLMRMLAAAPESGQ